MRSYGRYLWLIPMLLVVGACGDEDGRDAGAVTDAANRDRIAYAECVAQEESFMTVCNVAVVAAGATDVLRLTDFDEGPGALHPSWSKDGAHIAFDLCTFDESAGDVHCEVYAVDADGLNKPRRVAAERGKTAVNRGWSADGQVLVALCPFDSEPACDVLAVTVEDGSHVTLATGSDPFPSWSPSGERVAFASQKEGNYDVYVASVEGGEPRNVTNDPGDDGHPSWSPDGARIVFNSDRGLTSDLYSVSADGSETVNLTASREQEFTPNWSPDGAHIAYMGCVPVDDRYVTDGEFVSGASVCNIYSMNADGSGRIQLSTNPYDDLDARDPAWSGDGSRLAFQSNSNEDQIWQTSFVDADGSHPHVLPAESDVATHDPAWSPSTTMNAGTEAAKARALAEDALLVLPDLPADWEPDAPSPESSDEEFIDDLSEECADVFRSLDDKGDLAPQGKLANVSAGFASPATEESIETEVTIFASIDAALR